MNLSSTSSCQKGTIKTKSAPPGDGSLFSLEEEWSKKVQAGPARLLLTAGEKEGAEQVAESEKMVRRLRMWQHIGLEARFRVYKGAGHRASAIASLVDGVRWFFGKNESSV